MKKLFSKTRKKLTIDETQEIITPFAFKIDENLFGTAIASPWKRGIAIAIDLLLIAMLSGAGGELLAIALAIMAFRFGSKRRAEEGKVKGRKRRSILRLIGALILLGLLLDELPPLINGLMGDDNDQSWQNDESIATFKDKEVGLADALRVAGMVIQVTNHAKEKNCTNYDCWSDVYEPIPEQAINLELSNEQANSLFTEIVDATELTKTEQDKLTGLLYRDYLNLLANSEDVQHSDVASVSESMALEPSTKQEPISIEQDSTIPLPEVNKPDRPVYSFIELIKGIINDLGLGFGWAALYFTVFTSKWNGKTPGKRLLGIRVLQLDGTPLSLWDSFGRYGGYGAGIATGLLGFIQIYWDPNRQAMHDQISATVVIDENKIVDKEIIEAARVKIDEYKNNSL